MATVDAFTSSENERNNTTVSNDRNEFRTNDGASYLATPPSDAEQSQTDRPQPVQDTRNTANTESEQGQTHTSTATIRELGAELQRQLDDDHDRRVHENDRTTVTNRDEQRFNYLSGAEPDSDVNSRINNAAADERPNYLSGYDTMQRDAPQTPLLERLANAVGRTSGDTGSTSTNSLRQDTATNDTINTGSSSNDTSSPSLLRRVSDSVRRDAVTGSNGLVDLRDDVREANEGSNGTSIKETGQHVKQFAADSTAKLGQQIRESGQQFRSTVEDQAAKLQNSRTPGFDTSLTESASLAGAVDEDDSNPPRGFAASLGERLSNFFSRSTSTENISRDTTNTDTNRTSDEHQRDSRNAWSSSSHDDSRTEAVILAPHATPGEVVVEETVVTRNEEDGSETVETGIVMATPDALPLSEDSVKRATPTDTNASVPNHTVAPTTPITPMTPITPITPTTADSDTTVASNDLNDRSRSTLDPVGDHLLFVAG